MLALVLLILAVAVMALEFATGTFILLGLGLALATLSGVAHLAPETGILGFSLVGSTVWTVSTLALRTVFRRTAVEDPNAYDREVIAESFARQRASKPCRSGEDTGPTG